MALIKVDFFSESLMRTVSISAIVPVDKTNKKNVKESYKTLYLLHGIFGNHTDWICGTQIMQWAQDYDLAVIMPSGENQFYVDHENSQEFYSKFIGKELVEFTRKLFPLSTKREDTFIGGLSMGGYGAIVNGLIFHETFGHIVALSSALLIDNFVNAKDGDNIPYPEKRGYLESVFGDLDKLKGSNKDYNMLATRLSECLEKNNLPKFYIACGINDGMLKTNRQFKDLLVQLGYNVTYEEGAGKHNWEFWNEYIYKALKWLPLQALNKGINSGNIGV